MSKSWFVTGGAGFLGSHLVDALRTRGDEVTVYDNFSSGKEAHLAHHKGDSRIRVIRADLHERNRLEAAIRAHEIVVHLASNPDISKAESDPDLDFRDGTTLTRNVLEAAHRAGITEFIYASGSGVYGDRGGTLLSEHDLALPVSPYGAGKLAGEALVSAYAHMFKWRATILRFGNIVGPRQTHGVGFDFIRRLRQDPTRLVVLGNGSQSKPYVWVGAAVQAMLLAHITAYTNQIYRAVEVYNAAPKERITVREIAGLAAVAIHADPEIVYGTSACGWKGDVPQVWLDASRLRSLGWDAPSSHDAMKRALAALAQELL